jgi:xanthine dehydrogenase YagT iron-sulfur-binding subunit
MLDEAAKGWPSWVSDDLARGVTGPGSLDVDEIRERMSGNLCRCGAYRGIVAAVLEVASRAGSGAAAPDGPGAR